MESSLQETNKIPPQLQENNDFQHELQVSKWELIDTDMAINYELHSGCNRDPQPITIKMNLKQSCM
jgi:hypothetical protein